MSPPAASALPARDRSACPPALTPGACLLAPGPCPLVTLPAPTQGYLCPEPTVCRPTANPLWPSVPGAAAYVPRCVHPCHDVACRPGSVCQVGADGTAQCGECEGALQGGSRGSTGRRAHTASQPGRPLAG